MPVIHVDFKVPSEHWIEGRQCAAEYQIWQIQNRPDERRGAPAMAILIDDEDDKFNPHLQRALDAFQDVFDADMADCEDYKRKQRRLDAVFYRKLQTWLGYGTSEEQIEFGEEADLGFSDILDEPPEIEDDFQALRGKLNARRNAEDYRRVWDPWHTDLYRTVWFYGYEGSLTEPPCTGEFFSIVIFCGLFDDWPKVYHVCLMILTFQLPLISQNLSSGTSWISRPRCPRPSTTR